MAHPDISRLALIKEYGYEAVYGRETTTLHPDGSMSKSYSEGMPVADFRIASVMGRAQASAQRGQREAAKRDAKRKR